MITNICYKSTTVRIDDETVWADHTNVYNHAYICNFKYSNCAGGCTDPYSHTYTIDWEDLDSVYTYSQIAKTAVHSTCELGRLPEAEYKERYGYIPDDLKPLPAMYHRHKTRFIQKNMVFLDFDQKKEAGKTRHEDDSIDTFLNSAFAKKYKWILFTSKSHQKEPGKDCFHVVFPIQGMFKGNEGEAIYKEWCKNFTKEFKLKTDPAAFDVTRQIAPGHYSCEDVKDTYKVMYNEEGEYYDATEQIAKLSEEYKRKEVDARMAEKERKERWLNYSVEPRERKIHRIHAPTHNKNTLSMLRAILYKYSPYKEADVLGHMIADNLTRKYSYDYNDHWVAILYAISNVFGVSGNTYWYNIVKGSPGEEKGDLERLDKLGGSGDACYGKLLAESVLGYIVSSGQAQDLVSDMLTFEKNNPIFENII